MNERYSDLGTSKQMQMKNRILLGDARGGDKKTYVVSNLDILYDNGLIDDFQREAGNRYWAWRTTARGVLGYTENRIYRESVDESNIAENETETEDGVIWEMFNIVLKSASKQCVDIVDACCNDADKDMPLAIIQAHRGNLSIFALALDEMDRALSAAPKEFEKRCAEAKNNIDAAV